MDYTPPSGFSGFDITPYLAIGGGKQSKGAAIIWVSDGGATVSELPSALRTLTNGTTGIHNHTQLMAAHDISQPGDEIILENDFTSSTTFTPTRFGTQTAPIVYRGRVGTAIAPKMPKAVDLSGTSQHLWFYGIDFTGAQEVKVGGEGHRFRRCYFWPNNPVRTGATIGVHVGGKDTGGRSAKNIRFDYCTGRLSTEYETGGTWSYNTVYGLFRTYLEDWNVNNGTYSVSDCTWERCHFIGGPIDTPYTDPNCQHWEVDCNPQASGVISVNFLLANSRVDLQRNSTQLDMKTGGMYVRNVTLAVPNEGQVQLREHQGQELTGVRTTGRIVVLRGPNKILRNVSAREIWLMSGFVPYDDQSGEFARNTYQRPSYAALLEDVEVTSSGGLAVGKYYPKWVDGSMAPFHFTSPSQLQPALNNTLRRVSIGRVAMREVGTSVEGSYAELMHPRLRVLPWATRPHGSDWSTEE